MGRYPPGFKSWCSHLFWNYNEAAVVTSGIFRSAGAQSFRGAHSCSVCVRLFIGVSVSACRDDNGTQTRWVFTPLEYGFESTFRSVDLLMDTKSYLLGLWTRVCSYDTQTRKPIGFLNLIQPSTIVIFIYDFSINLISVLSHFLF